MHHPNTEELKLTAVLYALSDATRLGILKKLAEQQACTCSAFVTTVSKSTMSHHFRVLREAGLIRVGREGTQHLITLRADDLEKRFPGLLASVLAAAREREEQ